MAEDLDYLLERAFRNEIASVTQSVLRGDPVDWADYRYQIGRIRGIQFAMDQLVEMRQKVLTEDGDFE